MTARVLVAVREAPVSRMGALLSSREVHQALSEEELDPFLVVSLFEMSGLVFPPHPHAGFSVATYILPESPVGFLNQDSLGTRNEIRPGGAPCHRYGCWRAARRAANPQQRACQGLSDLD